MTGYLLVKWYRLSEGSLHIFSRSRREVVLSGKLKGLCGGLAAELRSTLAKALGLSGPQVLLQHHRLKHPH